MYVGIDVSKSRLDVKGNNWAKPEQYRNTSNGVQKLVKKLGDAKVELVVMEATGGYERLSAKALQEAGIKLAVMNPWQVRNFAKGLGLRAKTDAIDAELLSKFGETVKPAVTKVLNDEEYELRQLLKRRMQLVAQRVQEKNRLENTTAAVRKSIREVIKSLKAQIKAITAQIEKLIDKDEALKENAAILQSAKGVGKIVAFSFCGMLPELGKLNRKQIAALVGVAPFNHDSGNHTGQRTTAGGRSEIRSLLYMATLTAIRCNPKIKSYYKKLVISKGKKKKVALVACMRKFLVCLNAMLKTKKNWI